MARKRREKEKITDPFERARLKKLRSAQRREERKKRRAEAGDSDEPRRRKEEAPAYDKPMVKDDYLWIRRGLAKSYAMKVINDHRERPYWLSIPRDARPPVSNYYPCTMFRTETRMYYGFLFREHRDLFYATLSKGRKEFTDTVRRINPSLFA